MAWHFGLRKKRKMPSGLWLRCEGCGEMVYKKDVEERLHTCPKCNYHFRISARERVRLTLDGGTFEELFADLEPVDVLDFRALKSYREKIDRAQESTGLRDAALCGLGAVEGRDVVFLVTDGAFIQGSMGVAVGEKIARAADRARELGIPLLAVSGSGGGARMEEGLLSLLQLSKTSAALCRLHEARVPYVAVLTHATMGGALASWASLGDVTLAEPGALIGFAGPRVIRDTVKTELPEGFQTSEFLLEKGFVDEVVSRPDLRAYLGRLLGYCRTARAARKPAAAVLGRTVRP